MNVLVVYNNILSVRSLEQTKLLCNVCCCCILAPSIPLPQMSGSFVIALFRLSLQLFRLLRSDNLAVALTFNAIQSNLRNFKIAVFLAHVPPNNQSGSTFLLKTKFPSFSSTMGHRHGHMFWILLTLLTNKSETRWESAFLYY